MSTGESSPTYTWSLGKRRINYDLSFILLLLRVCGLIHSLCHESMTYF
jgi:hypothetical protein